MDGSIIAIIISAVFVIFVFLYFGIRAIVKKCKEDDDFYSPTKTVENTQIKNISNSEESSNSNTKSIDEDEHSIEESKSENTASNSNSLSNKSLSHSSNSVSLSVLESNGTSESTTTETTTKESLDNKTTYKNYNYNYHPTYFPNNHSDSYSVDSRHFSSEDSRHFSSDEKSFSFHKCQREPEHYTTTNIRKSTKIAHCCNKCRDICAVCHKDTCKSAYCAYICSDCSDKLRYTYCPVCGGRMSGSDQAHLCTSCSRKYGNKCFKCD